MRVNKPTHPVRHTGFKAVSTGGRVMRVNKPTPTDRIPSPLMGEESKVRVKTMHQHRHVIADLIRNPEVKGGVYNNATPTDKFPLSLDGRGLG